MPNIQLTIRELILAGSIISSVATGYSLLLNDMKELKKDVLDVSDEISVLAKEMYKQSAAVNFLLGEATQHSSAAAEERYRQLQDQSTELRRKRMIYQKEAIDIK